MKILLLAVGILISNTIDGQVIFEKVFGGTEWNNKGYSVKQDNNGFIYFLGDTDSSGNFDLALTKMQPNGEIIWTKLYGTPEIEAGAVVIFTKDDQLLLLGHHHRLSDFKSMGYLVKVDTSGQIIWEKIIEDPDFNISFSYVETAHDSGFVLCGFITEPDHTENDIYAMKVDSVAEFVWDIRLGYDDNDYAQKIKKTLDGGYVISGDTKFDDQYDNYIARIDSDGELDWELIIGDEHVNGNQDIIQLPDGSFVLSGESTTPLGFEFDVYLAKVSSTGNLIWAKYAGYQGTDAGFSIKPSSDGNLLITGYSNSYNNNLPINVYLAKIDTSGHPLGVNYYSQPSVSIGYELIPDIYGNYLISGFTGTSFYLLNVKDTGYTNIFSNGFSIASNFQSFVSVYPNPINDILQINIPGDKSGSWSLIGLNGIEISSGQLFPGISQVTFANLSKGTYLLKVWGTWGLSSFRIIRN